jgi:hypothetical protein
MPSTRAPLLRAIRAKRLPRAAAAEAKRATASRLLERIKSDWGGMVMSQIETFPVGRPSRESAMSAAAILSAPERLVGVGFRCWLAGFQTGDIGCWEVAWEEMSRAVGARAAKPLMNELACWVRAVQDAAAVDRPGRPR